MAKVQSFNNQLSPNAILAMLLEDVHNIKNIGVTVEWVDENEGTTYSGAFSNQCSPKDAAMLQKVLDKTYDSVFISSIS